MTALGTVIGRGTLASRPAAGTSGALYYATDNSTLYRDNGSTWDTLSLSAAAPTWSWSAKTSAYTITTADGGILVDTGSGAVTITLPTAVGATQQYAIKKKTSDQNKVTVATTSSQTIDGVGSWTLGAQNQGLVVASDGSNWYRVATPAGPEKIDEKVLTGTAASITFSSISGNYRSLILVAQAATDAAVGSTVMLLRLNSDSGANYDYVGRYDTNGGGTQITSGGATSMRMGNASGTSAGATYAGSARVHLPNYSGSTFYKQILVSNLEVDGSGISNLFVESFGGNWKNTAAVTALSVTPSSGNFISGSVFTLYGEM